MTATASLDQQEQTIDIVHLRACAFLKGYIVGYSKREGMKWDGDPSDRHPNFQEGWRRSIGDWSGGIHVNSDAVTVAHIIHNRLRHERPHMGSREGEQEFISRSTWENGPRSVVALFNVLREIGVDVEALIGKGV